MKREVPQEGEVFEMAYPFVRDKYTEWDEDGSAEVPTWKPGVREEPRNDDSDTVADGIGKQTITIVGTFKPGRFPRRVFFTRKWTDPDGKVFGKDNCRVTTINAFRSLTDGYRHPFECKGVKWGQVFRNPYGETTVEMLTALIEEAAGVK